MSEDDYSRRMRISDESTGVPAPIDCASLPALETEEIRKTLESIGDGFFACDGDWRFVYLNSAAENLMGINRTDVIGKDHWEAFPRTVGTQLEKEYRLAAAGEVRHFEFFSERCGRWFENNCFPREGGGMSVVFRDITERKRAEDEIAQRNAVLAGINTIFEEALKCESDEELGQACLRVAEQITGSRCSFIGEVGPDGSLHGIAISNAGRQVCGVDASGLRKPPDNLKIDGLCGRVFKDGKSLLTNDPSRHPDSISTPPGHPPLTAFLGVPLRDADHTTGMIAVGNREGGYGQKELEALEALAPIIVQALYRKRGEKRRKQSEEALRASEERLRLLGDNLPNSFVFQVIQDPDGLPLFLHVSAGVERLNGVKPEDVLKDASVFFRQLVDAEMPDLVEAGRISARELSLFEWEMQMRLPDGQVRWMHVLSRPRRLPDGRVIWDGVQTDITERKCAEEALRESEAKFRSLFENSMDAVFLSAHDGEITAANPAACAMFGMTEEELCRVGRAGIIDPDDPRVSVALEERARTGKTNAEISFIRKDGTRFDAEVSSVILRGQSPRSFVVVRDITERKRALTALLRGEKLASVGRMAATIAHEINNPLEAVTNSLFLAQTTQDLPDSTRQHLQTADEELRRVAHITRQSLGFYRETTAPELTSVTAVLDSTLDLLRNKITVKNAVIQKRWQCDHQVTAVQSELRQVFSNLLSNSLDAIDDGGVITLWVSGGVRRDGRRCVRISVADNGTGVSPTAQPHVFEPLFTTKDSIGTGLGLWVSKQIVDKHGGTIRMRSSTSGNRRGTIVSVSLPLDTTKPR